LGRHGLRSGIQEAVWRAMRRTAFARLIDEEVLTMRSRSLGVSLMIHGTPLEQKLLDAVLDRFSEKARGLLEAGSIRVHFLGDRRYKDVSRALQRLGADAAARPVPPPGLFVVEERTAYFRSNDAMTIAHELLHGCDCALGEGVYFSGFSARWRQAFARTRGFVTPYAATGLDEAFAESARALFGINTARSPWPDVSPELLRERSPEMAVIIEEVLGDREA
ncbi:MAG: hypothetical protein WCE83_11955, partial [Candidatus Baltobacteraceae bacterium]